MTHASEMREARAGLVVEPSRKRISADAHVFWACFSVITFFVGATLGDKLREPAPICRSALPDGRKLMEYDLNAGACIYEFENPKPKKWRPT
jgi:hypothetical protein